MIHYDIDTLENGYKNIKGSLTTIDELKKIIDDYSPNFVGYIKTDTFENLKMCISAVKGLGVFIGISNEADRSAEEFFSLFDNNLLSEVVDVWIELYVSKGLFIPADFAWIGIEDFITKGVMTDSIQWISSKDIPDDGNWII